MSEYGGSSLDDLVIGEAVALALPAAGLGLRILAGLVDLLVAAVSLLLVTFTLLTAARPTDDALGATAWTVAIAFVLVGLPTILETTTRGRTLGKLALGLRTVRDDAGPIAFHHAFTRALVGVAEIYLFVGVPAFFSALFSARTKRLGDHAAGTYVVRARIRVAMPPPPLMPPHLAGWAASADVARLPSGLAIAIRRYLAGDRTPSAARLAVGSRLVERAREYVAPAPPPGTGDDDFLAAVMATRRERDARRLARDAELRHRLTGR